MKKVINGKIYNTETATLIHQWDNGRRGDFSSCEEDLYRTKKGAFFIHGGGGPNSRWFRSLGPSSWCGGEDIEALEIPEVRQWLENHEVDPDVSLSVFPRTEEA